MYEWKREEQSLHSLATSRKFSKECETILAAQLLEVCLRTAMKET
jgi:hypothetical protein